MIDCTTACELIESNQPLTKSERNRLSDHLDGCFDCRVSAGFEDILLEVIVPAELPTPSAGFEASLMAELDLAPAAKPLTMHLFRWSKIITASVLVMLLFQHFIPFRKIAYKTTHFLVMKTAGIMLYCNDFLNNTIAVWGGQFSSFFHTATGQITVSTGMNNVLIINLFIGTVIILGSAVAVGFANRD